MLTYGARPTEPRAASAEHRPPFMRRRAGSASLGEGGPALHTETCARMPRHARTQTGTRVIICDVGQPAPIMVLSGRQEPLAGLTPCPPRSRFWGEGALMLG
ncbi:unnamed protein product [Rangifer tarandus platyrhynchus]|uniref:Uncharacterized protein n=1 Tax=Rangifer tarandus platyrhynchus TaxID=3082113 RepID=A0AC59Y455_RANTA